MPGSEESHNCFYPSIKSPMCGSKSSNPCTTLARPQALFRANMQAGDILQAKIPACKITCKRQPTTPELNELKTKRV